MAYMSSIDESDEEVRDEEVGDEEEWIEGQ